MKRKSPRRPKGGRFKGKELAGRRRQRESAKKKARRRASPPWLRVLPDDADDLLRRMVDRKSQTNGDRRLTSEIDRYTPEENREEHPRLGRINRGGSLPAANDEQE